MPCASTLWRKCHAELLCLLSGDVGGGGRSPNGVVAPWRFDQRVLSGSLDHPHPAPHSLGRVTKQARRSLSLAYCSRLCGGFSLTPASRIWTERRTGDIPHDRLPYRVGTVRFETWSTSPVIQPKHQWVSPLQNSFWPYKKNSLTCVSCPVSRSKAKTFTCGRIFPCRLRSSSLCRIGSSQLNTACKRNTTCRRLSSRCQSLDEPAVLWLYR